MGAGFGYLYETLLIDRSTALGLTVSTVPAISVPNVQGSDAAFAYAEALGVEVLREAKDREGALAAVAAILADAHPEAVSDYYDSAARQGAHEVSMDPVWLSAARLVDLQVIPIESSPLSATSISSLIGGAGLGPTAAYVAITAGVAPAVLLLLVGGFGIVTVSAATGLGEGLRERLRRWAAGTAGTASDG